MNAKKNKGAQHTSHDTHTHTNTHTHTQQQEEKNDAIKKNYIKYEHKNNSKTMNIGLHGETKEKGEGERKQINWKKI